MNTMLPAHIYSVEFFPGFSMSDRRSGTVYLNIPPMLVIVDRSTDEFGYVWPPGTITNNDWERIDAPE